ncbi:unnamed protein product, partial [marine sediment metagenome]
PYKIGLKKLNRIYGAKKCQGINIKIFFVEYALLKNIVGLNKLTMKRRIETFK